MADIRFQTPPHDLQQLFIDCDEREQLFGGAKRGGKSHGGSQKATLLSQMFPGNRGLIYRKNLTDLKDSTLVTFLQVCPPSLIRQHHLGDRTIYFKNGSMISYRGVGDEKELEKVKGMDLGWMWGDEPSEIEESTYLMMFAQLNWKLPNNRRPPYMSFLTCNPEPGWVKKRFIDPLTKDRRTGRILEFKASKDRIFVPSLPTDNPYLPPDYVAYLLANFPEEWVNKYVQGSWEISEGMVYKEFDRATHVVDGYPPLSDMKLYGAIDHATTGVTAFLIIGVTANHDYFVIREYYQKDRLVSDHAAAMLSIIAGVERAGARLEYILIDPATGQRSSQGNYQLQDVRTLYAEAGIHAIPAWNLIEAGVERVKQLLHPVPNHIHPFTHALGAPHLFIYSECRNLIDEFQSWKKDITPDGFVKYKGPDHALDLVRYIAVSRPAPPTLSRQDEGAYSAASQSAIRSHNNWARKFDQQVRRSSGLGANTSFDYFNQ